MLRRGFKAEAERVAERLRSSVGLSAGDPASPPQIAQQLGVTIRRADELIPIGKLRRLHQIQAGAFSACTFRLPSGRVVIVYNPLHSEARVRSDVAHELAHLILNHETRAIETVGPFTFFTCDADQEDEANWLAGCLLLPRPLLLAAARRGWSSEEIAQRYEVSEAMARFRLNSSGVLIQTKRAKGQLTPSGRTVPRNR